MKIQCACGAKYAFDVTPEMAENPVRFVCQNCGLDSSDFVNGLIRQELGLGTPAAMPPPLPGRRPPFQFPSRRRGCTLRTRLNRPVKPAKPPPAPKRRSSASSTGASFARIAVWSAKNRFARSAWNFSATSARRCARPGPKRRKSRFPSMPDRKSVVEAQFWRKTGKISGAIAAVVVALLGFWFWYAWFGSVPHPVFSVRFTEAALFRPVQALREKPDCFPAWRHPGALRHQVKKGNLVASVD